MLARQAVPYMHARTVLGSDRPTHELSCKCQQHCASRSLPAGSDWRNAADIGRPRQGRCVWGREGDPGRA
eukprot:363696-Chlamydomonas_euryale.AAC.1